MAPAPAARTRWPCWRCCSRRRSQVLGITMVTGNAWRDEETLHTLRMLELTGHADMPVARGAVFPLVRTQEETRLDARSTAR